MPVFIRFFALQLLLRVFLLFSGPDTHAQWADSRGIFSDLAISGLLALLCSKLGLQKTKILLHGFIAFILYLMAANALHVHYNGGNMSVFLWQAAAQKEFVLGSALSAEVLGCWLALLAIYFGKGVKWQRWDFLHVNRHRKSAGMGAVILLFLWPLQSTLENWRQQNVLEENLRQIADSLAGSDKAEPAAAWVLPAEGAWRIPQAKGKPNILLLVLESVSANHLSTMPYLKSLTGQGLYYPNFLYEQRQTHNGLYALLCGDVPTLQAEHVLATQQYNNKWAALARGDVRNPCLAERLKALGYTSYFSKAAPLDYADSDKVAEHLGFDHLLDGGKMPRGSSTGWGLDDKDYFTQMASSITQTPQEPWFYSLTTAGTHQPYNLPSGYKSGFANGTEAAFHYLDAALQHLLENVRDSGKLENTIVIIVGDEAGRLPASQIEGNAQLENNHGFMLVLTPGKDTQKIQSIYTQSDLMGSVLSWLGAELPARQGVNLFREHESFTPRLFANSLHDRIFALPAPGELSVCDANISQCQQYRYENSPFGPLEKEQTLDEKSRKKLVSLVRASDAKGQSPAQTGVLPDQTNSGLVVVLSRQEGDDSAAALCGILRPVRATQPA